MLTLLWNLSAAIRGCMRFYMPTNIAIDLLRTPRGLKWCIPAAFVAVPAYLYAMSLCARLVADGGPGVLNALVILFFWNSMKFAWMAVMVPFLYFRYRRASPKATFGRLSHAGRITTAATSGATRPAVSTMQPRVTR